MDPLSQNVVTRHREAMALTKARQIGTCGLCEQEVKCPGGTLAHHGYKRPGYGYITGSCPGTHELPFEISPVTAEIGVRIYDGAVKSLTKKLRDHDKATVLHISKGWRSNETKEIRKEDADPNDWRRYHSNIKERMEYELREASALLKRYKTKVQKWEPAEVKTVEEEVAKKRQQAEAVRAQRMERYTTNRDKTIGRLHKAFEKVKKAEAVLKSARDGTKIAKALQVCASGAHIIYSTYHGKPEKLEQNYPGPISRAEVIQDWGMDDMLEHMGLKTSSGYVGWQEVSKMEQTAYGGNSDEDYYLWIGLDGWAPFWPGWRGKIHYPEGSTGRTPVGGQARPHW